MTTKVAVFWDMTPWYQHAASLRSPEYEDTKLLQNVDHNLPHYMASQLRKTA
jgi:hypothetical protein